MFISPVGGADASAVSTASQVHDAARSEQIPPETVRHMLFGSLGAVRETIKHLHKLRYAEANDWSEPMATGRPNEMMAILTRKVRSTSL